MANGTTGVDPNGTKGTEATSTLEGVKTVKQGRVDKPAQTLAEEQLRIAKHVVQAMLAVGIDCELAEASSAH
jgi:hypothetical protein